MNINVEIVSGNNLGGVYPFVVACLDNDLTNEIHKTSATRAAPRCVWDADNSFTFDLATLVKNMQADGKPEPTYLTFFVFDTGAHGIPSLGSCGVLLSTVHDKGIAKGDFPIVNGSGSLTLIVSEEKDGPASWFQSDKAKMAGAVGAVGLGALAAGLGAHALNKRREKKKRDAVEADAEAAGLAREEEPEELPEHAMQQPGGPGPASRPWWEPETPGDDDGDPARAGAGAGAGAGAAGALPAPGYPAHNVYAQQAGPYQGGDAAAFIRGSQQAPPQDGYPEPGYDPRTHA